MIRLLIADDHPLIRSGLRQLVESDRSIAIVGEAATGDEVRAKLATTSVDVVLLDIAMPGPGFLELLTSLKRAHPQVRVLVLSVHPEGQLALGALRAGAAGYVTKTQSPEELLHAVQKVHAGGLYVSPRLAEQLAAAWADGDDDAGRLSDREREVLQQLGAGKSNKEIASALRVSTKSVSTYRSRILRKLKLRTNADLVRYAIEHGLLT